MRYFRERFGLQKIRLTSNEQFELKDELKKIDQKRIEFFAFISLIASSLYLSLDFIVFNDEYQSFYIIFDFIFMLISIFVLTNSIVINRKKPLLITLFKRYTFVIFPAVMLLWAAAIAILNADSLFHILTYFITIFIISFALITPLKTYIIYLFLLFIEFVALTLILERPFITDTFILMVIGSIVSLPFNYSFRSSRENSMAAIIKLDKSNRGLENEVAKRVNELRQTNEDLEYEIIQRKMAELKLRDALKEAEENNQLKSEFLANISHEIRTPLNSIIGFTEMMTEDSVTDERKKIYQELVASNTMYLLSTVDDIFDASLVHTNQIKPIVKSINVNQFLESICYETSGIATKYINKQIELNVKYINNKQFEFNSDEYYLKKAFLRLVDNAYKFTLKGDIQIGAKLLKNHLYLYVKDSGIGIIEKDYDRIFEPFVQGDGSFTRGYGGSGLGLTIVSGIVKALECEFGFKSKPNYGSTFYLIFKS